MVYSDSMKPLKQMLAVALLTVGAALLLLLAPRNPFPAPSAPLHGAFAPRDCVSAATCTPAPDAFLKVNEFYVLFTYPIVPHLDQSGTFVVGLDALAEIMEAHTQTSAANKTETVTLSGHSITFRDRASTATVDGKSVTLPVTALWDVVSGKMIVPLSPILTAFHIRSRWDAKNKIMALQNKAFLTTITADPDTLNQIWKTQGSNLSDPERERLVPTGMKWFPVHSFDRGFDLTVKNISGKTIPRDRNHIDFVEANFGIAGNQTLQYGASAEGTRGLDLPPTIQSPLPKDASRTASHYGVEISKESYSLYVLAWLLVTHEQKR